MASVSESIDRTKAVDQTTETSVVKSEAGAATLYHTPAAELFQMEQRMAKLFVKSGLFADVKGGEVQAIAQAYVKIALGRSMGFSPAESMQGIDIIQGRPAVSAQLRGARMQRAGFSWTVDQLNNEGCKLSVFFNDKRIGEASFLKEDAVLAGLAGKDNWRKDPSSMYFARAITRAQRRFAPGVLSADIMSRDEAIDMPPEDEGRKAEAAMPRRISESASSQIVEIQQESPRDSTATVNQGGDPPSGQTQPSASNGQPVTEAPASTAGSPAPEYKGSDDTLRKVARLKDLRDKVGGDYFWSRMRVYKCGSIAEAANSEKYSALECDLQDEASTKRK